MGQGGAIASWLPVYCSTAPRFLFYLKKGVTGIFAQLQFHSSTESPPGYPMRRSALPFLLTDATSFRRHIATRCARALHTHGIAKIFTRFFWGRPIHDSCVRMAKSLRARPTLGTILTDNAFKLFILEKTNIKRQTYGAGGMIA